MITFNGVSSQDLHIQVEVLPGYDIPERDYELTHVPGRNGDILIDSGSYKNVNRSYYIAAVEPGMDFVQLSSDIAAWLHSTSGYAELSDSYEPDYYRLAMYKNSLGFNNLFGEATRATITFECKPQRYLVSGKTVTEYTYAGTGGSFTLTNPTNFVALPIIKVYSNAAGTITIGDYAVDVTGTTTTIIDSEIQDVYNGSTNLNPYVTLTKGFPKLLPGDNLVTFSSQQYKLEVQPRWWTL